MGAWGTGIFDDDTSCDIIYEVMKGNVNELFEKVSEYKDSEYLEYEECYEILVSGAILEANINGTKYQDAVDGFDSWVSSQNIDIPTSLQENIVLSLKLVISDNSEINELWEESEDAYPTWKGNVESLIQGLSC